MGIENKSKDECFFTARIDHPECKICNFLECLNIIPETKQSQWSQYCTHQMRIIWVQLLHRITVKNEHCLFESMYTSLLNIEPIVFADNSYISYLRETAILDMYSVSTRLQSCFRLNTEVDRTSIAEVNVTQAN